MKIKRVVYTILLILFLSVFSFVLVTYKEKPVEASTTCPSNYTPSQCLDYLDQQLSTLQKQKGSLQDQLNAEQYTQLTLQQKISYINNQITQTENVIQTLEVEIAAENIQITMLENDIQDKEDNVSLLRQEVTVLEQTVNQRVTESYKYSFVGPMEIFLDSKDLSTVLRKTKYLIATRAQDVASLEDYSLKITALKKEEDELSTQKTELQAKKEDIEKQKTDLAEQNQNLTSQKAEQSKLLAESKAQAAEYLAQLTAIASQMTDVEASREKLILQLYGQGQLGQGTAVVQGDPIGIDGHTGCAIGTHLHFSAYDKYGNYVNPKTLLDNGTFKYPLRGAYITQYYSSTHHAIDMVSTTQGNQDWSQTYTMQYGICTIVDNWLNKQKAAGVADWNQAHMTGEGATVYAATTGTVYYYIEDTNNDGVKSKTDNRDAKYAMVVSKDGKYKTFYVHLKY